MSSSSPSPVLAHCECCSLTEECTPEYIALIRQRCHGRWLCGLCWEATKDEIVRSDDLITTEEALNRHMSFCNKFRSSAPTDHLISVVTQLLRRSLDSPQTTPRRAAEDGKFSPSGSCFSTLAS